MKERLRNRASPPKAVQLRSAEAGDEPFLVRVYAGERAQELSLLPWDEAQKQAFVEMQFTAQVQHYKAHYPAAQQQVICADGEAVGRLYLDRGTVEFRILDVAVLPERRNAGIGTLIVAGVLNEARAARLPVTIYVEAFNPCMGFFEQLGFRKVSQDGFNLLMRRDP